MPSLPRRIKLSIALTLGAVLACILGLFAYQGRHLRQEVAAAKVLDATRLVREKFVAMAAPIHRDLTLVAQWGRGGLLDLDDPRGLSLKMLPLLESLPLVSGLLLADTDGREFFLLREQSAWLVRTAAEYRPGMHVDIRRLGPGGAWPESRQEARAFDPRTRPWFAGALQAPAEAPVYWTAPYRFQTMDQYGITAARRWETPGAGPVVRVAAMDLRLDELFRFLAGMQVSPGARVVLVRKDGTPLAPSAEALPRGASAAAGAMAPTADALVRAALETWEAHPKATPVTTAFRHAGQAWWAGFEPLVPGGANTWIGVLVPEADLENNFRRAWLWVALLGSLATAGGGLLLYGILHRYGPHAAAAPPLPGGAGADDLRALIASGENSRLEFKSTLRTNLRTGQADKAIELAWLKSVAAFLNSSGGTLLVGVGDDGGVVGIAPDGFDNPDKALLHVKNLVNQHIGAEFSRHIDCRVHTLESRTVVAITCGPAENPVFLAVGKNEDFYIRSGPSSTRLSMSQMVRYLEQRR